ncbi:MAG: exodeoxyribonuclease III, partial [Acidimicrobiales bacterium]
PRVEQWLAYAQPDVLCLQETKLADAAFPVMAFQALGYEAAFHGDGRWNGVALLSRVGLDEVVTGFSVDPGPEPAERRLISATCAGARVFSVYVPNGRSVGSEHFLAKLGWLGRLRAHLEATCDPDRPVVVCGDFNVAPTDLDVWDPTRTSGATHVTPEERAALGGLIDWGLVDAFRLCHPGGGLFTWWDYRAGDFHNHRGMRIDLVLASRPLAERVTFALVDRNARKGRLPSDHAPVLVDFDVEGP